MTVLSALAFLLTFGLHETNELTTTSFTPLCLMPRGRRRALTAQERDDFDNMIRRGPMLHSGVLPGDNVTIRKLTCQRIPYTVLTYNSGHQLVFTLGVKFTSIRQAEEFIQLYNIAATRPRVRNLLRGGRNKLVRRQRAHKICLRSAFEAYYNGRSIHGTTVRMFRRRGLIQKMEV